VAAHTDDLQAAQQCGLKTAYIHRPTEYGARKPKPMPDVSGFDYSAESFTSLAAALGC